MNTIEYYIELRAAFRAIADQTPFPISTTQIAELLHCSLRNTRILLKKMSEEGLIVWEAGKGRGNSSQLTFRLPLATVTMLHFQSLQQQNKIDEAIQFLDRKEIPVHVKKKCYTQLRPNFGLQSPSATDNKTLPDVSKKLTFKHIVRQVKYRTSKWVIGDSNQKKITARWPTQSDHF
jgi:MarR-like DNA-binding transcriptional regulator SgrR of sgrS sRNA